MASESEEFYALSGKVARGLSMVAGILTMLTGIVHAAQIMDGWCVENDALVEANLSPFRCIGESLAWNTDQASSVISDVNAPWRLVFTLQPDRLMLVWTPLILGVITVASHFGKDYTIASAVAASGWIRHCCWLVFVIVFGLMPAAGNMGVVVGLMVLGPALACVVARVLAPTSSARMCISEEDLPDWRLPHGLGVILRLLTVVVAAVTAILTLAVGLVVLYELLPTSCPRNDTDECVGPGIYWIGSDSSLETVDPVNSPFGIGGYSDVWGELFNLAPSLFLENFAAIIFGVAGIAAQLSEDALPALTSSWGAIFLWHMIQALFANMGYAGNLGVATGFLSVITAFLAMLTVFCRDPPTERRTGLDVFGYISRLGHGGSSDEVSSKA